MSHKAIKYVPLFLLSNLLNYIIKSNFCKYYVTTNTNCNEEYNRLLYPVVTMHLLYNKKKHMQIMYLLYAIIITGIYTKMHQR